MKTIVPWIIQLCLVATMVLSADEAESDAAVLEERAVTAMKQIPARQEQVLRAQLQKTFPPEGMWHYENFALAAYYLNEETAKADQGILRLQKELFPTALESFEHGSFHWHAYLQQRLYFLFSSRSKHFPGRMGIEAEQAILQMLWDWAGPVCRKELASVDSVWWYWGSENHHLMAWVSFWGAAHIFKDHPEYKNRKYSDGSSPAEMAAAFDEYFKAYARERATKGLLVEVASPTYVKYSLNTWYNIADFAEDPVLKKRMDMLLNLYWADWAIEQIDGVRGGSRHRCYTGGASIEASGGSEAAWYHFGIGTEADTHPGSMCAATTFWRPLPIVAELALGTDSRGSYSSISRRPGLKEPGHIKNYLEDKAHPIYKPSGIDRIHPQGGSLLRTTWCTPDFVKGMSQVEPLEMRDWTAISGQNRWNGIIFAGHPTSRIFTQRTKPKRGSVYNAEWGVQSKGVMILQRLRTSNGKGQMIWFSDSLKRHEKDGWIFIEAPQAYAAVRVTTGGGEWRENTSEQSRDGKGVGSIGEWFVLHDEYAPIVFETVRKKDFPSFVAFQEAIFSNALTRKDKVLEYRSNFYKTTLRLPSDASSAPSVNGVPVEFEPREVYKSPYLNGDFGDGVIKIQRGERSVKLDFTQE